MSGGAGLQEIWDEVALVLSEIAPIYDRVNRVISLGSDLKWRLEGLRLVLRPGEVVLDAGCGPGTMSDLALRLVGDLKISLLDPLGVMLEAARAKLRSSNCVFVAGTFEQMNFPDGSFDVVMCGFSLRDARNLELALREVHRVLKPDGGRLLVVDLGKPDDALMRHLIGIYWRYFVPLLAVLRVGKRGMFYSVLYKTYRKLPENGVLKAKLQALFRRVEVLEKMSGATVIIRCMR